LVIAFYPISGIIINILINGVIIMTVSVQLRKRGVITLPAKLRQRYKLGAGDTLMLIELDGGLFLTPKVSVVPKLAEEIEQLRKEQGIEVEDLLKGLDEERRKYYQEKYGC